MKVIDIRRLAADKRGMTLVEAIVSIAIIATVALVIASAVSVNANMLRRGDDGREDINGAYADNAAALPADTQDGALGFTAGGNTFTVDGSFNTYTQGDASLYEFVPDNAGVTP